MVGSALNLHVIKTDSNFKSWRFPYFYGYEEIQQYFFLKLCIFDIISKPYIFNI
jgi:hypothetical protein